MEAETMEAPQQAHEQTRPSSTNDDFQRIMAQPMGQGNVITPRELYGDMSRTWRFAKALARGCGLGVNDEAAEIAMARIFIGAEMGIGPAAAVRGIHFIKTRVALSADLMVAMAQDEGWQFDIEHSNPPGTWCEVSASHERRKPYTFRWTIEMAKKAGLMRGDSGWEKFPWDMLYARAASHVARKVAPGRLLGLYTPEEARSIPAEEHEVAARPSLEERLKLPEKKNGNVKAKAVRDHDAPAEDAHEQPPGDDSQLPASEAKPHPPAGTYPTPGNEAKATTPAPMSDLEKFEATLHETAEAVGIDEKALANGVKKYLLKVGKVGQPQALTGKEREDLLGAVKNKQGYFAI